jgi:phosphorylase kinase alpha/beta subunit
MTTPNYGFLVDPVVSMFYVPDGEGMYTRGSSSQAIFLMGQSLFIIAQLLTAGLLHVNELDPIRRYLPSYNRPRKGGSRYSAFQVSYNHFSMTF